MKASVPNEPDSTRSDDIGSLINDMTKIRCESKATLSLSSEPNT